MDGTVGNVMHTPSVSDQKKKKQHNIMDQKMNEFEFRRQAVTSKLQRIQLVLAKPEEITVHHLDTYLRRVDACYDEFNILQNEIYATFPDQRVQQEKQFIEFEQLYEGIRVAICSAVEAYRMQQVAAVRPRLADAAVAGEQQPVIVNQPAGLPAVPLPTFDGTYERWFRFKQLFQDLMQKHPGLSDATKLHYLTQSLKGKAENVISEQILNENNFQAAWNLLEERFENKRTIIDIHVGGLLNLKKMNKECSSDLRQLVEECSRHVEALEFHDQHMEGMSEQLVVSLLTSKLDKATLSLWESTITPKELPDYTDTMQFLRNRCFVLERCEAGTSHRTNEGVKQKPQLTAPKQHVRVHTALQINEGVCVICDESHNINKCSALKQMTLPERIAMVKEKQLCFNCLKRGHRVGQCKSRVCTVAGCGRKHHTQLHSEVPVPAEKAAEGSVPETKKEPPTQPEQTTSAVTCTSFTGKSVQPNKNEVILSTAVVQVKDTRGCYRSCRVLLDSGSQSNFMSENFVKMLRLKLDNVRVPIVGINGERLTATQRTAAEVKSSCNESSWSLEFLIVPQVTGVLPLQKIDVRPWNIPPDLNLADPRFNIPARVDMLIGAELFFELLITERLKLDIGQPMLWRSELGWIVCGSYRSNQRPVVVTTVHCQPAETNLEDTVQRFWEQEEVPETTKLTTENEQCIEHFEKTHRRENGRFVVRLPFRNNVNQLGDTRHLAERRFLHLERRFVQSPELKQQYVSFINEYLALGHCRRVEHAGNEDHGYYLPHHAIVKPTSSTTRLRVVFDASARSDTNLSLNDVLITGPVLQDSLMAIVLRFRRYKYVFTADIVKMYRQIRVDESDSPYQKILWRDNCQEPLNTLELTTVTYGTSCAPFCATACLKQLADDEQTEFPIASKVARKDFYMDDVLSGDDELQRALECQYQLTAMLQRGGFRLHKWCANTPELLERIPVNEREVQAKIEDHNPNEVIKTLGLLWDPKNDVFLFRTRPQDEIREFNTKRTVLSDTAKIFDPLGLLEPVTVVAKLFIQELWARGVNWDERLTTDQEARWRRFTQDLQRINELQIPRRALADDATAFEIHGFSDASQKAYGACVYLRSVKRDGTAAMHLLSSKTRVAPLPKKPGSKRSGKPFTIPRAELCGAHLMAKLVAAIIEHLDLEVHAIVLWCDSQIVLCWLNKSPDTLEVFVGNKVREIKQLTDGFEWRYINTKQNPADLASRGLSSSELQQSTIWWHGPSMLQNADYTYQHIEQPPCNDYELAALVHVSVQVQPCELLTRYSDFRRLQRIVAYIYRFLDNCRQKDGTRRRTGFLTVIELRSATQKIISLAQLEGFADEFRMLRSGQTAKSKLLALDPFIDREGMLRVGGRLKHANISFGKKHQLLLPRSHHVTKILIAALHKEHLHIGQQGLLAIVRQRYWPVRAKCTIRKIVKKCVRCFRMNPPEVVQFMGALPDYRVNPSPVFYSTGIDYAGPFFVRQGRRAAKVKAYVALFICMSTKAIHLELVSDLTSAAFLAALHRFVGRRGCPEKLVSDNATNFKGAHSELQELYKLLQSQQLQDEVDRFCAAKEIQWSFIPPRSPNFGGIWEAGVKAAKSHLKVILCEASLTYEEMNTVLVQIEAILNSRPLTQISNDANDLTALTPGHFLVGRELTAVPEPSYGNVRVSSLSRWQHLQKLKQDFWARWSAEYLSELQPRSKWYKDKVTVRPGMLVVIREDNMAPQLWHLGRITEVTPGAEGLVRVVKIRTANGEVTRSVSKIAILPIEDNTFPAKE